jgi:acyl transferase domain-containing protein
MSTDLPDAIAIVGMAGRFPGAPDVRAYWANLVAGVDSVTPTASGPRGTLADHDLFDAEFFGFSPKEAERTDPQHRLFLECAWEALEHAGYGNAATRPVTGVYAGSSTSRYLFDVLASPRHRDLLDDSQLLIGCDKDYLATRVSHKLDLRGPSVVVQTACATSLVAVHLASQALFAGECDLALAGGVSVRTGEGLAVGSDRADGMVSPDGRCRAFDANASGMVGGDGVGLVALRRLDDAVRDGDTVYAVILGSAVNNDGGRKVGYTAPGVAGQERVVRAAHLAADVDAATIGYVEAHGTGTRLGDPIEVAALAAAFGAFGGGAECVLGSVKTNIGHLDVAAGVASLIKVVLSIGHRVIPPTLHFEQPNPELRLSDTRFRVSSEPVAWQPIDGVRRAGVSSFGIGGTNAHVVVAEPPPVPAREAARPWQVIPVSARTPAARDRAAAAVSTALSELDLADAAWTLQTGRQEFEHRAAMVAPGGRMHSGQAGPPLPVAFLCTGQGPQYQGMAAGLAAVEPVFATALAQCQELLGIDPRGPLGDTSVAQPALFAVEYALARLWQSWGVSPAALIGHSVGELVAACLAGVLSLEDGAALVLARGAAMAQAPPGAMLTVAQAAPRLPAGVTVAAENSPTQTVVAGDEPAIADLERTLRADGVACRRLSTGHAFHTRAMDRAAQKVAKAAASVTLRPPTTPLVSNVTGRFLTDAEATDPSYWGRQVLAPVRFAEGLRTLAGLGKQVLVELGPGRSLCDLATAQGFPTAVPSLPGAKSTKDDLEVALDSLARLWVAGQPVTWAALHEGTPRRRIALPTYPFERRRYTVEPSVLADPAEVEAGELEVEDPPETEAVTEVVIAGIWARSLGVEDVDRERSFFEIGGNSLAGMQVLDEIARTFAVDLPLGVLYDHPTIAELALLVEDAVIAAIEETGP